ARRRVHARRHGGRYRGGARSREDATRAYLRHLDGRDDRAGVRASISRAHAEMGNYPITPMHTFMRQGQAIGGFDSFARLGQIKSPTLIIHGDDDSIVPYPNADVLQGAIAGSKKHTLKAAGHMFFWEATEETVRVAGDFLAAVKRSEERRVGKECRSRWS